MFGSLISSKSIFIGSIDSIPKDGTPCPRIRIPIFADFIIHSSSFNLHGTIMESEID
ncbi:hypothetical protein RR46_11531 [Papilio xuthus]|uniref:Uncharacterized protein n=1 Tax=Papilio xuthus TaxID=66420 RepID=A0A194PS78_PAPXU|nr:hypothetical protein RR46_11531 [Papilio xuthus]